MSPSKLARSSPGGNLLPMHHSSRAGIHLLLRTPQKTTQVQRLSPDENQGPLFGTDRKRLG